MLISGLLFGMFLGIVFWFGRKIPKGTFTAPFKVWSTTIKTPAVTTTTTTVKTWSWEPIVKRTLWAATILLVGALLFGLTTIEAKDRPTIDYKLLWELLLWGSLIAIAVAAISLMFSSAKTAKAFAAIGLAGLLLYIFEPLTPCLTKACTTARNAAEADERDRRIAAAEERVMRELQQKRLAAPPPDSQCTNLWETLQVGPTPVVFNQGGSCRWQMKSAGNCFDGTRAAWTKDKTVYSICDKGAHTYTEVPEAIESLWTANGRVATVQILKYPDPLTRRDLHLIEKLATSIFGKH